MNKKKSQRRHAEKRAFQRYGFVPRRDGVIEQIQTGKATFVERQSLRITVWIVEVLGRPMKAVYDKRRKEIVTYLPV